MTDEQLNCVKKVKVGNANCFKKCEGMDIISYLEYEPNADTKKFIVKLSEEYNHYKREYNFPTKLIGKLFLLLTLVIKHRFQDTNMHHHFTM